MGYQKVEAAEVKSDVVVRSRREIGETRSST